MKACFADGSELPIACAHDIDEAYNCVIAKAGTKKRDCECWQPGRAIRIALDILGVPDGTPCGRCNHPTQTREVALRCAKIAHNWRDENTGISCSHRLDIEAKIREEFGLSD